MLKIEAKLRLLSTKEGGRKHPWAAWWWCFDFGVIDDDGLHNFNDCRVDLRGAKEMAPGEERTVTLDPLSGDWLKGRIAEGQTFTVNEGPRIMGHGTILRIVD
jgi:hypothetical protein